MALDDRGQATLDDFFTGIACHATAFRQATFSYVALPDGDRWVIIVGSLVLHAITPTVSNRRFESPVARAGVFQLDDATTAAEFLRRFTEGAVETPHGTLEFPAASNSAPPRHAVNHIPFNPAGNQARLDTAQLMGEQASEFIRQPMLDWSLRASSTPYDGLADLIADFGLATATQAVSIYLVAQCATMIDASSHLNGDKAKLAIGLASGLDKRLASVGVLIRHQQDLERRHIASAEISWREEANRQVGEVTFDVPAGAILHCFACYDGIAHHRYWVTDPSRTQNPRRAALEGAELGAQAIHDMILEARADRGLARKFETCTAWLLWLVGFGPAHLGDTARTQDAPDIIVSTPMGHFAVVECTTGLIKNEKLVSLRGRALSIRQRLEASRLGGSRVLPVLVCARTKDEVEPERDAAAAMGIAVIDGDDLIQLLLERTGFTPDADRLYKEVEEELARRRPVPIQANGNQP